MPTIQKNVIAACLLAAAQFLVLPQAQAQSPSAPDLQSLSARPGYQLRALYIQTDGLYIATRKAFEFRDNIPYKKPVRIISNLFEFPEGHHPEKEQDLTNQFTEYMLAKYPEWIEKLRGHGRDETLGRINFFKGNEQVGVQSYRGLFDVGSNPQWQHEILYVNDFKYVERKAKPGWSKATLKVRSIIGDPAAGKP